MEQPERILLVESLPPDVEAFMVKRIRKRGSDELLGYLYDQFATACWYGLDISIGDYSSYFDDDEGKATEKTDAYKQGMLLGVALTHDWLGEEGLNNTVASKDKTLKGFRHAGNEAVSDNEEEPDWSKVLLDFGQDGLDMVAGCRELGEAFLNKIEIEKPLQAYFLSGMGMAIRLVLTERLILRQNEIDDLERLFHL